MIWWALGCVEPPVDTRPLPTALYPPGVGDNVLVIVLDDLGAAKLAEWGEHPDQPRTPVLSRLSAEGVRFSRAWASPVCGPSRAAALTGRLARRTGMGENLMDEAELSLDAQLLPEVLRAHAQEQWTSVALGKWHLAGWRSPTSIHHPLEQGFDHFSGSLGNIESYYDWSKVVDGAVVQEQTYATTDTTDDALALLSRLPSPWFAWVAYHAPHLPYDEPPSDLSDGPVGDSDPERFNALVEALDTELGRLLDGLPPVVRARTTIIVLGDNGAEARVTTPPFDPLRSKVTVYEGGVHVPLWVLSPEAQPGGVSDALVHVVDVFATVLELAGIDARDLELPTDGQSLLPYVRDPSLRGARDFVYTERFVPSGPPPYLRDDRSVRDEDYKLVALKNRDGSRQQRLFRMWPDAPDEGPDLLEGELSEQDQAALERLTAVLGEFEGLPYEGR